MRQWIAAQGIAPRTSRKRNAACKQEDACWEQGDWFQAEFVHPLKMPQLVRVRKLRGETTRRDTAAHGPTRMGMKSSRACAGWGIRAESCAPSRAGACLRP